MLNAKKSPRATAMRRILHIACLAFVLAPSALQAAAAISPEQKTLFNEGINYFDICDAQQSTDTSAATTPSSSDNSVSFDDNQSSDTGGQTTIDDDGVDPSPTGSGDHQSSTSYADGKLGALHTNYFALNPGWAKANGLALGDVGVLTYRGKTAYAVYGDNHVGNTPHAEISVHAAMALTGQTNPAKVGSLSGVHFTIYPGTHSQLNGSTDQTQIDQIGAKVGGGSSSTAAAAGGSCGCPSSGSSTTSLTGSDNEAKVWNYFKGKGLSDAQVAGIMGNMQQESSFNPTIVQNGGNSKDPSAAGSGGWGLIQWTPGSKATVDAKAAGISAPIYELATQLDLVWSILQNKPVVTQPFDLNHFKTITDPRLAATYFLNQIEGGTDPGGVRESNAASIMKKYGGQTAGASNIDNSASASGAACVASGAAGGSPDCQTAVGDAKIICEAKKYDKTSYSQSWHILPSQWHKQCKSIGPSCYDDCSGLVNLAIYDAFGVDSNDNTTAELTDSALWKKISADQVKPGDLIQPGAYAGDHVEIIDHIQGNTVYTFGSHTSSVAQPDQVGPASYQKQGGDVYLHYVGKGSS